MSQTQTHTHTQNQPNVKTRVRQFQPVLIPIKLSHRHPTDRPSHDEGISHQPQGQGRWNDALEAKVVIPGGGSRTNVHHKPELLTAVSHAYDRVTAHGTREIDVLRGVVARVCERHVGLSIFRQQAGFSCNNINVTILVWLS